MTRITCWIAVAAAVLLPLCLAGAQRLEFEVVSVKRNTANGRTDFTPRRSGDLVMMHNTQPYSVINYAYRLAGSYEMTGYTPLPDDWNWYDIEARAPAGATDDQVRQMFQSLLADRFKFRVHRETKIVPLFELVIAKGKPKLQPARNGEMKITVDGKSIIQTAASCGISLWLQGAHLTCHAASLNKITSTLGSYLGAPAEDRTGLAGTFDLDLLFLPESRRLDADAPPTPSLDQALQEELGLKLQKGSGPREVWVVDHIEKPSEN